VIEKIAWILALVIFLPGLACRFILAMLMGEESGIGDACLIMFLSLVFYVFLFLWVI
jgi:hypothetical protein